VIVGLMKIDLLVKSVHSLKEKRRIVSSIKEKLKNKFNISIIESDFQDVWQKIQISIALLSGSKEIAGKIFLQCEDHIFDNYPVEILNVEIEYL
jgi:hypothetical protein